MENPRPHHYLAVYGDPDAPGHVAVEDGRYGHRSQPRELAAGDMVLLYCTGTYRRCPQSAPGVGIVTETDWPDRSFRYDYLPFREPVPLEALRFGFEPEDAWKLANIRFDTYWFFRISAQSFRTVLQGARLGAAEEKDEGAQGRLDA